MRLLSSLTNRIFLATTALAVLAIGFGAYLIGVRMVNEAEAELQRGLLEAGRRVEQYRTTLVETMTVEARLLADLPKLKAAVATSDPPTVEPIAADYRTRVGADGFLVTDHTGRVLAAAGVPAPLGAQTNLPGIARALAGEESTNFWPLTNGLLHTISVPIAIGLDSPEVLGTLSVGLLFDEALAVEFERLSDARVAFALDGRLRGPLVRSTSQAALAALLGSTGVTRVALEGIEYVALVQPLSSSDPIVAARPGPTGAPVAVREARALASRPAVIILRSRTDRLRFVNGLLTTLAGAALLAVALAIGLSYGVARTVTRPLADITAAMREMSATGDLTRKIATHQGRWHDEDASLLAATFNALTDSIAHFQREAAERDRLSSLGRLSTVIAHEIRNPLMIIKASVRTIRRQDVAPADAREAAGDIDEEVARLDRVVNDVLDFARPLRFELAPVDLNTLCAECAAATTVGDHRPAVHVTRDDGLPRVLTDADRLRTALVNLIVNAQQAVSQAHERRGGMPLAPIRLSTGRPRAGTIAIVVSDLGGGISAEDLPRVFDPYYTTRRTGTGLGLPIAKNIVEGLGGAIVVDTHPGKGTDMRIELPEGPAVS